MRLLGQEMFTDVTIASEGKRIKCHKVKDILRKSIKGCVPIQRAWSALRYEVFKVPVIIVLYVIHLEKKHP